MNHELILLFDIRALAYTDLYMSYTCTSQGDAVGNKYNEMDPDDNLDIIELNNYSYD